MEVINSTDIIGEEIKEEARKKASLILHNAEEEIENLISESKSKLARLKSEQLSVYQDKIKKYKESSFVTLPLKKWKEKTVYVEDLLCLFLEKYFSSLDTNSRLFIIKNILRQFKGVVSERDLIVRYSGFEKEKVEKLVLATFPNCKISLLQEATHVEKRFYGVGEGIIIEDVERTFICKAGLEQAKNNVCDNIKEELFCALFGGTLSE